MSRLSDIQSAAVRKVLGNRCFSKITLAINAASAATVKSTGACNFTIGGVFYTKTALTAQSIAVTHRFDGNAVSTAAPAYVQPAGTTVFYVLALNSGGTVAVVQGSYAGQSISFGSTSGSDLSKVLTGDGDIPQEPDGYTAIGVIKVATAGAATFTPGTTALDAANVTATYYDVSALPASL